MQFRTERLVERCRLLMADGKPWTIRAMAKALGCCECTASARIRDQRKQKYGSHKITKRPIGGVFEYRMVLKKEIRRA